MRSASPVSRPAWFGVMNALAGTGAVSRKSPAEIVAGAAAVVTRSPYAEVTGIRDGRLGRWIDGVATLRGDRRDGTYWPLLPVPAWIAPIVSSFTDVDAHPVDLKGTLTEAVWFGG